MTVTSARGGSSVHGGAPASIAIPNSMSGLKEGSRALTQWLSEAGIGPEAENKAHLVFDEIVTNTIRYAFTDQDEHAIAVSFVLCGDTLTLVFEDDGIAFDPCTAPQPANAGTLADASVGGRGLMLVRKAAKRLDYERTPSEHNKLTVALDRA
jgi:serine/threonine-protein kinase RsbW